MVIYIIKPSCCELHPTPPSSQPPSSPPPPPPPHPFSTAASSETTPFIHLSRNKPIITKNWFGVINSAESQIFFNEVLCCDWVACRPLATQATIEQHDSLVTHWPSTLPFPWRFSPVLHSSSRAILPCQRGRNHPMKIHVIADLIPISQSNDTTLSPWLLHLDRRQSVPGISYYQT